MSFGKVKMGGSPAFSVLLRGIPKKNHEKVIEFLKEVGLLEDEKSTRLSLELNQLLIPQIGEYSAIYIAGKLKNYCKELKVGLAQSIHKSNEYEDDNRGIVSIDNIKQNKEFNFTLEDSKRQEYIESILCSSSSSIEGYQTIANFGIITEKQFIQTQGIEPSTNVDAIDFDEDLLISKLKLKAFESGANAIVSMNFNLSAISENNMSGIFVIIQGDAVIIEEKSED